MAARMVDMAASKSPAATATLEILKLLSRMQRPVSTSLIIDELGLPRSTAYQLLKILVDEGFLVHLDDTHRYALGLASFEVGAAFSYQQPLTRIGERAVSALVARQGHSGHLCVMHGRDVLYIVESRAPSTTPLVTDVGVRLPSHLTASGRSMLAAMPPSQVRAIYPDRRDFTTRHGTGPSGPAALKRVLDRTRALGFGFVDDDVSPGMSSVAVAIKDTNGHPIGSVALTFPTTVVDHQGDRDSSVGLTRRMTIAAAVSECALEIEQRLLGRNQA